MFHVHLTGMCFLLLLNEVCSVCVRCCWFIMFNYTISSLIFYLSILSIIENGVLRFLKSYGTQKEELQTKTLILAILFIYVFTFTRDLYFFWWLWFTVQCPLISSWETLFSIFCRAGLLVINSFNFCLSSNALISSSSFFVLFI